MSRVKHGYPLVDIINGQGMKKIVEIGVYGGALTKHILQQCKTIEEYWAVDPWTQYVGYSALQCNESRWEQRFLEVCRMMKTYPALKIIRDFSTSAAKVFDKGYFDLVFIDANHSYDYVKKDINIWLPLVKPNGVICGHDYSYQWKDHVAKAVNERFGENIKRGPGKTWFHGNTGNFQGLRIGPLYDE